MELDQEAYSAAIALLSVHGSIALADAVLASVQPTFAKAQDHGAAARSLRDWCSSTGLETGGIKHFQWLLAKKNHFSYDEARVDSAEVTAAKLKMDQFFAWAFRTFPQVAQLRED